MNNKTLLIFGGVALALYLYSKNKSAAASKTAATIGSANNTATVAQAIGKVLSQTNPHSNNPNLGVNSGAGNSAIGKQTQQAINDATEGYNAITGIIKGVVGSGSSPSKTPSNNPTNNPSFDVLDSTQHTDNIPGVTSGYDYNNNATGNQSFDDLDITGEQTGGWGSSNDVAAMTLDDGSSDEGDIQ